jgi:hypothetical protein
MTHTYIPLVPNEQTYTTKNSSEAAAYIINKIPLQNCTWDEETNEAYFTFERNELLEETIAHYFERRLRGCLLDHDTQRQVLIRRIRGMQR